MPTKECPALCAGPETESRKNKQLCNPEAWGHQVSIDPVTRHSDSGLQQLAQIFYTPHPLSQMPSELKSCAVRQDVGGWCIGCRSWLVRQHVPRAGGGSLGSLGRPGLARHAGARPSHPGRRAEISPPRRTGHFVPGFLDKESIYIFIRFCIHPFTTNLL